MIGIRLADGKFFSICGDGPEKKRVVLSPANKDQKKAKIDLFRFDDSSFSNAYHIGSLFLENVDSEIELSIDTDGNTLVAEALSPATGVKDTLTALLAAPLEKLEEHPAEKVEKPAASAIEVKGIRSIQIMVGMVLALLLFLTGFLLYTMIPKERVVEVAANPPVLELAPAPAPAPEPAPQPVPEPKPEPIVEPRPEPQPVVEAPKPEPQEYIRYKVKYGDTLWSIANDFCKDPYMYKRIAKENHLSSPDKLISGTVLIIPAEKR